MNFPASSGPWFDLTFSSPSVAARFAKKFAATYPYQAVVHPANPKMVTTNGSKEEIEAILKMLNAPRRRVYVTRTLRDPSRQSSAKIRHMAHYEGSRRRGLKKWQKKAKKRVKASHRGYHKAEQRQWDSEHRPSGHHARKAARKSGGRVVGITRPYLSERDTSRYSFYEKGTEALRSGYSVAWRPSGAGVKWFLRSPKKRILAHGHAHDGDKAIALAKHALANETVGHHGSSRSRGHAYTLRNERDKRHHHRSKSAPSFTLQSKISRKIRLLREEGYPPKQAAAIAYRMYGASRSSRRRTNLVRAPR